MSGGKLDPSIEAEYQVASGKSGILTVGFRVLSDHLSFLKILSFLHM